jgi:3-oxoacyl-[acyl-carrier-protein] synthase II
MNRVAVTGIGCLCGAGVGPECLRAVLSGESISAEEILPEGAGSRRRPLRVARIPAFDRLAFLPARKLRKMEDLSQIWVICAQMALSDAGLGPGDGRLPPPERRGVFLGTGFGCIDTTWRYLAEMFRDGAAAANPYLFAESVANAPAGHGAIELDARGANVTVTSGDASAAVALERGVRALREGRLEMACCGGIELMSEPLVRILSSVGSPGFVGEGSACLVLETMERALGRKARIYAEVTGTALASDPEAPATLWSRNPEAITRGLRIALASGAGEDRSPEPAVRKVFLHAPGHPLSDAAEMAAVDRLLPGVPRTAVSRRVGTFAAAGGVSLAAGAMEAREDAGGEGRSILVHASSWGGGLATVIFRGAPSR